MTAHDTRSAILIAVHSARTGGAQLMALSAAEHLAADHELHIAVPHGPLYERFAVHGTTLRASPTMPFNWGTPARWAGQLMRAGLDALRIAAYIRRHRIGAVYVNSLVVPGPALGARLAGVPAIVHVRELPSLRRDRVLVALQARVAETLLAISEPVRASLGPHPVARVKMVPDGARLPAVVPPAPEGFHTPLRLCLIGTIDADGRKGQDIAIKALAQLTRTGQRARLRLVGPITDPAVGEQLRALADALGVGDDVELTGATDDVDQILADTDLLISAARQEPLGLVVIEALARERPVVATRVGGVPEIVRDGVTGMLVDPEDPSALGEAVARTAADPAAARAMARAGRIDVGERFSLTRQLELVSAELVRALGDH